MDRFDLNLQRDQLSSQVSDQLEELIVARELAPGEKLPAERELAETLGVSRSVVREALRTLSARGLVQVKPGCGAYVCQPSTAHSAAPLELLLKLQDDPHLVEHLFEVRRTIELDISAKAALRAQPAELARLRALWEEMRVCGDLDRYAELDVAFHLTLAQAAHNELYSVLLTTVTRLLNETIRVALQAHQACQQGVARHLQIIEALEAHDPALARAAMLGHVDEAQRNFARASAATGWQTEEHD